MATGKTEHIGNSPLSDMKGIFMSHGMRGMRGMGTGPKVMAGLTVVVHISWVMFLQMDHCLLVIHIHYFHWINSRVLDYSCNL